MIQTVASIHAADAAAWNRYGAESDQHNPFINWHFFAALEDSGAAAPDQGWHPQHLLLTHADGSLRAALPCYRKTHSHGDFVYDWGWARATGAAGLPWYPKLVAGVPYSPVTSSRLLRATNDQAAASELAANLIERCRQQQFLTAQLLFPPDTDADLLREQGYLVRRDYIQFHWHNRNYPDFEAFLTGLRHKKRKQIRQERQRIRQAGITLHWLDAAEASPQAHAQVHRCYSKTFLEYGNLPVLSQDFFTRLGQQLPGRLWYCLAQRDDQIIAAAVYLCSDRALYGRYWGAFENLPGLHFEVCYYQGIEFCIARGLQRFEPGVHGEHKISRGFLPAASLSAHYFNHERVRHAAVDWLRQEQDWMHRYRDEILRHSPYHAEVTDDLLARSTT